MRAFALAVVLVLQADSTAAPRGAAPFAAACVPTEHMPIAGLRGRPADPMTVVRPDTAFRSRMPVIRLQACYLLDSLRPLGR